jgi:fatty-acyl-CoA synthase
LCFLVSSCRIIRGGENIGPREVEDYLYTHPAIQDVTCFGVADPVMGEEVAVAVVLKAGYEAGTTEDEQGKPLEHHGRKVQHGHHAAPASIDFAATKVVTPSNIKAFCKGQIAHYKTPRYTTFVQDFPKTG